MKSNTHTFDHMEQVKNVLTNYKPGFSQTKTIVEEKCAEYLVIQKMIKDLQEHSSHIQNFLETQTLVPIDGFCLEVKNLEVEKLAPISEFVKKGFSKETLLHKNLIQADVTKKFTVYATTVGEQETK